MLDTQTEENAGVNLLALELSLVVARHALCGIPARVSLAMRNFAVGDGPNHPVSSRQ